MPARTVQADYLIVGAGAIGMAFADTLLTETDASIVMVDRHDRPGGHWNDAYSFVRLHQPSAFYGLNSSPLGHGGKDLVGLNQGLCELASGAEVLDHFCKAMDQRFLPSGRVRYFPMCNMVDDHAFESLLTGERWRVEVARKRVDATYSDTAVPATHAPRYAVAPGVRCIPLNDLPGLRQVPAGFVVVGGGKTGIDACLWLLAHGVSPQAIRWIIPRDAWLLDRKHLQPGAEFFATSFASIARQFEAVAEATSQTDLFDRLEAAGELLRLDPAVRPSVYRCATVTQAELTQLRGIENVIRLGRVRAIEAGQIVLAQGQVPLAPDTVVVDCSASAIPQRPSAPVFDGRRITPQMVRTCQPTFSAAFIAHVETAFATDAEKNALCSPVPPPYLDVDWLRMLVVNMRNRQRWGQHPGLEAWLQTSRLNSFFASARQVAPDDVAGLAVLQRYQQAIKPAMANLPRLLAELT